MRACLSIMLRGGGVILLLLLAVPCAALLRVVSLPGLRRGWIAVTLRVIGVRVRLSGALPQQPVMLAANHVSWLDILILGRYTDARFVAKSEIRQWPLIGWLAESCGTEFFVRGAGATARFSARMAHCFDTGDSIALFPEGTTTAGYCPGRFYPQLFQAATQARVPVQPVALSYSGRGARAVPFVGDAGFVPHLCRLIVAGRVEAELAFMPQVQGDDTRQVASLTHRAVAMALERRGRCAAAAGVSTVTIRV